MCWLCQETKGGIVYCQACGNRICFDTDEISQANDRVLNSTSDDRAIFPAVPAYIALSGDVFCTVCGPQMDYELFEMDSEEF